MKRLRKYSNYIIDTIRQTKKVHGWSISDFIEPINQMYESLSGRDKKEFRASICELLEGNEYLEDIITIIWMKLKFKEVCPLLFKLFENPPQRLKEEGHYIGTDGIQTGVLIALGELKYKKIVPLLKHIIEDAISKKDIPDSIGVAIEALAKLSPQDAGKYFGWWIDAIQKMEEQQLSFVKTLDDWKIMEKNMAVPVVDTAIHGFFSVKDCIISVAKNQGRQGLKKWLSSITLYNEKDKEFLRKQIKILADGSNELFPNLRILCNYKGESNILATELASLPRMAIYGGTNLI